MYIVFSGVLHRPTVCAKHPVSGSTTRSSVIIHFSRSNAATEVAQIFRPFSWAKMFESFEGVDLSTTGKEMKDRNKEVRIWAESTRHRGGGYHCMSDLL